MPFRARIFFHAGVFALFSSIGLISLATQSWRLRPIYIFFVVFITGAFAVGYAAGWVARKFWLMPLIGVVEAIAFGIVNATFYDHSTRVVIPGSPLQRQLQMIGIGSILLVGLGYGLFIAFFARQGSRLFRAQTEIALAGEIHRALVPVIDHNWGSFQIYGASIPSGEVGGDLVDVVGGPEAWTAYVADVSGHGVAAGLLMAMFKTAVHTLTDAPSPDALLREVHRALYPLKTRNTFVTAGVVQCKKGSSLSLSLAGHPPLLRYDHVNCRVEEYASSDMPVGILSEQSFTAVPVTCAPNDVLLLLTDGLSEVFDKAGNELGIEPIKQAMTKSATLPLPELFVRLRQVALSAGKQEDDQTLLLIRRVA